MPGCPAVKYEGGRSVHGENFTQEEGTLNIRKMAIADYEAVYQLWMSCTGMGLNNLDDSEEGIARFLERNPETCFVAEEKGIVGVILAGHDGRRGYIYHTSVDPECRRRGIGAELLEHMMKAFEKIGIHKVALVVFSRNETGNLFWERQGFTRREDLVYRNKSITELVRIDT